ncbi:MAG: MarR family transcriptional regulator [Pseudonocardiaceae bacterium]|nr:MarR family transcriptional regulator [Pseudonocardiaceae bacterium]
MSASRVLVAVAARSLSDIGEQVTLAQYRTLIVLASRGPQRPAHLAEALAVAPSTATRMCDRLVRRRWVRRQRSPRDRRTVRITLTPEGRDLVDVVSRRRRQELHGLLARMSADQRAQLLTALQALSEVAGERPDQEWAPA